MVSLSSSSCRCCVTERSIHSWLARVCCATHSSCHNWMLAITVVSGVDSLRVVLVGFSLLSLSSSTMTKEAAEDDDNVVVATWSCRAKSYFPANYSLESHSRSQVCRCHFQFKTAMCHSSLNVPNTGTIYTRLANTTSDSAPHVARWCFSAQLKMKLTYTRGWNIGLP